MQSLCTKENLHQWYVHRIHELSEAVQWVEKSILWENPVDVSTVKEMVVSIMKENGWEDIHTSLETLQKYSQSVEQFTLQYKDNTLKEQVGRLFWFRPDKIVGDVHIKKSWPVLQISFSDMQDLLSVKFARRKDAFTQEDKASGFFKVLRFERYEIPVCVIFDGVDSEKTVIHEMTHLRNNILGMTHYSQGGWVDMYEQVVYDGLQEEILAFFSEWLGRADIQLTLRYDPRYHFYRRLEDTDSETLQRFMRDVMVFVNIAREVKELRPENYIYDLALIPIKKWGRYLKYLRRA